MLGQTCAGQVPARPVARPAGATPKSSSRSRSATARQWSSSASTTTSSSHPKFRHLFEAEVESMANFCHPYAVEFLEAAIDDPIGPCLVLEYVPGITLEALLIRNRMLSTRAGRQAARLSLPRAPGRPRRRDHPSRPETREPDGALAGLADTSRIKVMDFGFAGFAASPTSISRSSPARANIHAMGTPAYVSPEMIRGDTVDHRSDLYAVGVILYELLTGRLPFDCEQYRLAPDGSSSRTSAAGSRRSAPSTSRLRRGSRPTGRCRSTRTSGPDVPGNSLRRTVVPLGLSSGKPPRRSGGSRSHHDRYARRTRPEYTPTRRPVTRSSTSSRRPCPNGSRPPSSAGSWMTIGGQVLASEPGLIRMRLGVPEGHEGEAGRQRDLPLASDGHHHPRLFLRARNRSNSNSTWRSRTRLNPGSMSSSRSGR